MKQIFILISLNFLFLNSFSQKTVSCIIETSLGAIQIELYPGKAPITVANFLKYVDQQLYDETSFFRVCTPENETGLSVSTISRNSTLEEREIPTARDLQLSEKLQRG